MPRVILRTVEPAKAVGVPVGREALHAVEGVLRDVRHHPQRQPDDAEKRQVPHDQRHRAQGENHRQGADCGQQCAIAVVARGRGDGVDQLDLRTPASGRR